jgi:nucleoside-diphosphate-sugar epimerase
MACQTGHGDAMRFERVLVTGGAGFIGNRLVRELSQRKVATAVVDNLLVKMPMPTASQFVRPYEADIRNQSAIEQILSEFKPEAIVHLAAIHHIPTCERYPSSAISVNILGTQILLDAAEKYGVKNFVLASSAAVYDWWDSALIEDETPLKATDVYSTSKLTNEHQLATWVSRTRGRGAIGRIFNVIGHDDPNGHLIPDILSQLEIEDGKVRVPRVQLGNTLTKRDYTHADDTARGILSSLDHLEWGRPVEAFNISYGEEHSAADLVEAIGRELGCDLEILHDETRVRHVDRLHLLGDQKKAYHILGWKARHAIDEALHDILTHLIPH